MGLAPGREGAPVDDERRPSVLGWTRALVTSAVVAVLSVAMLVYVPNALVRWTRLVHAARVGLAVAAFLVALAAIAAAMRWLQGRGAL